MNLNELLLPEFEREMENTRKTIERIPEDKLSWKPHPKSWSLAELVTHICNLPTWAIQTLKEDRMDLAPPGVEPPAPRKPVNSQAEALKLFAQNTAAVRELLTTAGNESLMSPWTLLSGGHTVFTMPRLAVLRSFFLNHIIHHRAQLTVYLRLNDVAVPAIYGPSADESPA